MFVLQLYSISCLNTMSIPFCATYCTLSFSPVTRKVENKKHYDRKKSAHVWKDDFGMSAFCLS